MDTPRPIRLNAPDTASGDSVLVEIEAAIELVSRGRAVRVALAGLFDPEAVAADALARAQLAGVEFRLERNRATGSVSVLIGPLTE